MEIAATPLFLQAITNTLVEELQFSIETVSQILGNFRHQNCKELSIQSWDILKSWLHQSNARDLWNKLFYDNRSEFVSQWIKPHIIGNKVLDLLCGDGAIGKTLMTDYDVYYSERRSQYDVDRSGYEGRFQYYEHVTLAEKDFDTVLLIAVLHHEEEPDKLIEASLKTTRNRIIVIENCLYDLYDQSYQDTIDLFFNQCLNETKLLNPGKHRTANEWIDVFAQHDFKLVKRDYKSKIPGIPMPHDLFIFDRQD